MKDASRQPQAAVIHLVAELARLASVIELARSDLAALGSDGVTHGQLNSAGTELDATLVGTAAAAETIMDAAERIVALAAPLDPAVSGAILAETTRIFEACSFQDLTGQRITKVMRAIGGFGSVATGIQQVLAALTNEAGPSAPDGASAAPGGVDDPKSLMNGPALPDAAPSQDQIDAMFGAAPAQK